ncbi:MAG TPA: DNA repair protein RadC, partial [Bacteroidia bacterium]|nr:DNA repair protein RadC [Bacteroidia bacterium]
MLIRELPEDERPREKLLNEGASALSDAEILAVFFGTGRAGVSAVDLGREIISHFGSLRRLSRATHEELVRISGVGPAKASQLAAVFEFGRRLARETYRDLAIETPEDAFSLVGSEMQRLEQESVRVILLNNKKRLLKTEEVFRGTRSESFASPAEILKRAIVASAQAMILVHNHPSGDPTPSRSDHETTRKLKEASEAVGIELVDHLIVGAPSLRSDTPYF